ncbi:serine carboxypeptidase [Hymenopellis radicata]|nr:serine carboxypeptidase [Hymenopellis radicata]
MLKIYHCYKIQGRMIISLGLLLLSSIGLADATSGQFPVVDGILGGVANATASVVKLPKVDVVTAAGDLRVTENSGICGYSHRDDPRRLSASGYGDIAANKSIWFWFFAARNNPETAPLSLWFNGGPGSSSMIGLLQELGPCRITNDSSSVTLNPFSWNNNANVLFIDQPVGVGFSHGTLEVGTSQEAASDVWDFLQIFLADDRFAHLQQNALAIWTESYGGHYGPTFAAHFLAQNTAIAAGTVDGLTLNLKVLGVGDGLTDPLSQYPGYISYAASNPYHTLVSTSVINRANNSWSSSTGCKAQITSCYNGGSNRVCSAAQSFCNNNILSPLAGDWDVYYVPTRNPDPYPPAIDSYLDSVADTIGAESTWQMTNDDVYSNFAATGDWMRNSRPDLETVIDAGVRTIVYVGDADYILNFNGIEAMVDALDTKFSAEYATQEFTSFTVNGQATGQFKNAGTFSFVRINGAGHEVPAYTFGNLQVGEAAFQMFSQIMSDEGLSGT